MEIAVLALGCFWEPEIKFSKLNGVVKTEVGYCGGITTNTNYKEVCSGKTNHAEVVRVEFDNSTIAYKDILNYFFEIRISHIKIYYLVFYYYVQFHTIFYKLYDRPI